MEPAYRQPATNFLDTGAADWQWEPAQYFMRNCLREKQSPYWNPYSSCGALGPEVTVDAKFSPFTLAIALLGASTTAFHIVLLGALFLGTYFCVRFLAVFLQLDNAACFIGGLVFATSGFALGAINTQMGSAYLLTPPTLFALTGLAVTGTVRWLIAASIATALLLATSFISTLLLAIGFCFTFAFVFPNEKSTVDAIRPRLFMLMTAGVLGLLLTVCIWAPFISSLRYTTLAQEYGSRNFGSLPPRALLSLFVPEHFWDSYTHFGRSGGVQKSLSKEASNIFHLGLGPAILAVASLGAGDYRRRIWFWFLVAATVFGIGMQWRPPPFDWLGTLPGLRSIRPHYFGSLTTTGAWILAALGLQSLRNRFMATVALLVWAVPFFLFAYLYITLGGSGARKGQIYWVGLFLLLYLVLLFLLYVRPSWVRSLRVGFLLLCCIELFHWENHTYFVRRDLETNLPNYVNFLKANLGDGRILCIGRRTLYPEWGSAFEIPQVDSMNISTLVWYRSFLGQGVVPRKGLFLVVNPRGLPQLDLDALRLMSVRFLIVQKSQTAWLRYLAAKGLRPVLEEAGRCIVPLPGYLPRAFIVRQIAESSKLPWELGQDPISFATTTDSELVERMQLLNRDAEPLEKAVTGAEKVSIRDYQNGRVTLKSDLKAPGLLLLSDSWHPSWKVTVNGKAAKCARVDRAFRGVLVPSGPSKIRFTYQNEVVSASLACSALTAFLLIIAWWTSLFYGDRPAGWPSRKS